MDLTSFVGFCLHAYIKLISNSDFTCGTDDFQKSRKTAILKNCVKNLSFEKIKCLMFFMVARPVCIRLYFDLIKHFTPKPFISRNVDFCILTKKRGSKRKLFQKHH